MNDRMLYLNNRGYFRIARANVVPFFIPATPNTNYFSNFFTTHLKLNSYSLKKIKKIARTTLWFYTII